MSLWGRRVGVCPSSSLSSLTATSVCVWQSEKVRRPRSSGDMKHVGRFGILPEFPRRPDGTQQISSRRGGGGGGAPHAPPKRGSRGGAPDFFYDSSHFWLLEIISNSMICQHCEWSQRDIHVGINIISILYPYHIYIISKNTFLFLKNVRLFNRKINQSTVCVLKAWMHKTSKLDSDIDSAKIICLWNCLNYY